MVFLCHDLSPERYIQGWNPRLAKALLVLRDTGAFGLCLFFFLSAYLITTLLAKEKQRTATIRFRSFYLRRVLRIWPLYFLYVGAIASIGIWLRSWHIEAARLAAMFLLVGNWYALLNGMGNSAIAALWSISVEEQFYLLWPAVFRVLTVRRFAVFAVLVGVASLVSTFLLARGAHAPLQVWLNSAPQGLFFAAGSLVAVYGQLDRKPDTVRFVLQLVAGVVLWICGNLAERVNNGNHLSAPCATLEYALVACGCFLLLDGFLRLSPDRIPGPFIYLGRISYGLYVFHELANHTFPYFFRSRLGGLPFAQLLVTFPVTVAFAALSYRFLESPFLRLKERFEVVRSRAA